MDEALISNWNEVVRPTDTVYHLGDFCYKGRRLPGFYSRRLNGNKFLLFGNHDKRHHLEGSFGWMRDTHYFFHGDNKFFLSHYAHRSWRASFHGSYHFYGHSHGNLPPYGRSTDVGVDCWDYYPVNIETLVSKLKNAEGIKHHD